MTAATGALAPQPLTKSCPRHSWGDCAGLPLDVRGREDKDDKGEEREEGRGRIREGRGGGFETGRRMPRECMYWLHRERILGHSRQGHPACRQTGDRPSSSHNMVWIAEGGEQGLRARGREYQWQVGRGDASARAGFPSLQLLADLPPE